MKRPTSILWLCLTVIAFIGTLIWTTVIALGYAEHRRHVDRKQADLDAIRAWESRLETWQAAQIKLETATDLQWNPLAALVRSILNDTEVDVRRRETIALPDAWQVQQWEIDIRNHDLDGIGRLLTVLESQRPPWRIQSLTLTASDAQPANARVHVMVERVERHQP